MSVTPAVSYLSTGFAGYLVGSGISCGARKLAQTPRVIKKKNKRTQISLPKVSHFSWLPTSNLPTIYILSLSLSLSEIYIYIYISEREINPLARSVRLGVFCD